MTNRQTITVTLTVNDTDQTASEYEESVLDALESLIDDGVVDTFAVKIPSLSEQADPHAAGGPNW